MFNHDYELEKSVHPENFEPTIEEAVEAEAEEEDDSDYANYDQISQG